MSYFITAHEEDEEDFTKDVFFTEQGPFGVSGFNMDGKEVGMHCEMCNSRLETSVQLITHFSSKKHTTKVKQLRTSKELVLESSTGKEDDPDNMFLPDLCKVCNAELNTTDQSQAHYMSDKHQKKVRHYFLVKVGALPEKGKEKEEVKKKKSEFERCNLCSCDFTSEIVANAHYLGKKHAKKLKELSERQANKYFNKCFACGVVSGNARQYEIHMQSSKHAMMVGKLKLSKTGELSRRRAELETEIKNEAAKRARLERELAELQETEMSLAGTSNEG
ncbi:uncharacterized protein LOC100185629 isoform X1 [Ciona intestinalis]